MTGRIRSIKPEWIEDERLNACSDTAIRMSFVLFALVDDDGRCRASVRALGLAGWKFCDSVEEKTSHAQRALDELVASRWLIPYQLDGYEYWQIRNWSKHQKIDKYKPSKLPAPPPFDDESRHVATPREHSATSREDSSNVETIDESGDSRRVATARDSSRRVAMDRDLDHGSGSGSRSSDQHTHEPSQAKAGQPEERLGTGPIVGGIDPEEVRLAYVERWEKHARGKRPPMVARGFGSPVWSELAQAFVDRETTTQILDAAFVDPFVRSTGWTPKAILGAMARLSTADVRAQDVPEKSADGQGQGTHGGNRPESILGAIRARHDEELLLAEKCALRGDVDGKLRHTAEAARLRIEWKREHGRVQEAAS